VKDVYRVDLPISGRWVEVKECLIKEVVMPRLYALADRARQQHKPFLHFYQINREFFGIAAKLCTSDEQPFTQMIALPFLGPNDLVPAESFLLLFREPASQGLLMFAKNLYAHQFPQLRRGAPAPQTLSRSTHRELNEYEISALSIDQLGHYMADSATAAHDAQPEMYTPYIFSLEKEEARAVERQQILEDTTVAAPHVETRRAPTGIPCKDLRAACTDVEKRHAMMTSDGHLVVHRSVTYH
jgi:hypothetical protein